MKRTVLADIPAMQARQPMAPQALGPGVVMLVIRASFFWGPTRL